MNPMKRRIFAFLAAMLMLVCGTLPAFALSARPLEIIVEPMFTTEPPPTPMQEAKAKIANGLDIFMNFWRKHAVVFILVLILIVVVVVVTISEMEEQKKRDEKRPPEKKHKK